MSSQDIVKEIIALQLSVEDSQKVMNLIHRVRQTLSPELEGMDDIFSKICELIVTGKKGDAKKLFAEALDKANTEKESQIVSLQDRIDFQVETNDMLYADQKKELKNVIAGKIALQTEIERLKAENNNLHSEAILYTDKFVSLQSKYSQMIEALWKVPTTPFVLRSGKQYIWVLKSDIDKIIEQSKGKE